MWPKCKILDSPKRVTFCSLFDKIGVKLLETNVFLKEKLATHLRCTNYALCDIFKHISTISFTCVNIYMMIKDALQIINGTNLFFLHQIHDWRNDTSFIIIYYIQRNKTQESI